MFLGLSAVRLIGVYSPSSHMFWLNFLFPVTIGYELSQRSSERSLTEEILGAKI
jgi:hypothetical protein